MTFSKCLTFSLILFDNNSPKPPLLTKKGQKDVITLKIADFFYICHTIGSKLGHSGYFEATSDRMGNSRFPKPSAFKRFTISVELKDES